VSRSEGSTTDIAARDALIVKRWNADPDVTRAQIGGRFSVSNKVVGEVLRKAAAAGLLTRPLREPSTRASRTGRL
jgi:DNA-binding transcriptional regulator LsrR (DeoR family)